MQYSFPDRNLILTGYTGPSQPLVGQQIADRLKISPHTVHTYIRRIYEKLHVHSHAQAVARYAGQAPQ